MRNKKILVVDDTPIVAKALKLLLENYGYDADMATAGTEALEKSKQAQYNVSIIDLTLPDLDGIEVCRAIKRESPWTTCILMTGCIDSELTGREKEFRRAGGSSQSLYKPFSDREVLAVVQASLLNQNYK